MRKILILPAVAIICILISCSPVLDKKGITDVSVCLSSAMDYSKLIAYDGSESEGVYGISNCIIDLISSDGSYISTDYLAYSHGTANIIIENVPYGTYDIQARAIMRWTDSAETEETRQIGYGISEDIVIDESTGIIPIVLDTWGINGETISSSAEMELCLMFPSSIEDNPIDSSYNVSVTVDKTYQVYSLSSLSSEMVEEAASDKKITILVPEMPDIGFGNHTVEIILQSGDGKIIYKGTDGARLIPDEDRGKAFPITGNVYMALSEETDDEYIAPDVMMIGVWVEDVYILEYINDYEAFELDKDRVSSYTLHLADDTISADSEIRIYLDGYDVTDKVEIGTGIYEETGQYSVTIAIDINLLPIGRHVMRTMIINQEMYGMASCCNYLEVI